MERYTTNSKRKINIEESEKGLILREASFEPSHIFECGQCFNFHKEEDGSYTAVFMEKIINVLKLDDTSYLIRNISLEDFNDIFYDYFDLGLDYEAIKEEIAIDPVMEKATSYGYGIRILNQEVFETTISFIISANNQIPRIKKAVRIISERYGNFLGEYKGRKYYSFPTPEVLMKVKPEDLREYARVGFRDKRIVEASRMIYEGHLAKANDLDTENLRKSLIELPGVGPKVADCILLFAYHRRETFPVDVWIKRVMETLFIKKEVPKKQVDEYARKYFGKNAGYAQQYLFYYGREEKIGK
ncbi:DNA-3-methyladenine glycosylase [Anaerococcus sp.]|uniref:DNA-3-methyladenine glycosylase family protein n=1 Tax=Anaerococcus sp. TaxID=1872515 RepID=UPI0027BA01B2|nr:8-oxoguanine DNA glycosylase [Anaerococcus sp.]